MSEVGSGSEVTANDQNGAFDSNSDIVLAGNLLHLATAPQFAARFSAARSDRAKTV